MPIDAGYAPPAFCEAVDLQGESEGKEGLSAAGAAHPSAVLADARAPLAFTKTGRGKTIKHLVFKEAAGAGENRD